MFPTKKKPFYVYPNPAEPEFNEGLDMVCRGRELSSGGRRINNFEQLEKHVKEWGLDPKTISMFLQAFKYGIPPHGGLGLGLERLTSKLLGLENIKEATLFPRDINRIDNLLSS